MEEQEINNILEEMNKEYLNIYNSKEYRIGRKFLIIKDYLKKFKLI